MADELSDLTKARKDLLWGMYTDVRAHARHAETLRTSVVSFMILTASVLIAMIANDRSIGRSDIVLALAIAFVGLIGLAFTASYTELHQRNRNRAARIRSALETEFFADQPHSITTLLGEADADHESSSLYRWGRRIAGSTHRFWFMVPALILLTGIALFIIAL